MDLKHLLYFTQVAFSKLGVSNNLVQVRPTNTSNIAMALGGMSDMPIPWLPQGKTVLGVIDVNLNQLSIFTREECQFVISHECTHIYNNHTLSNAGWALAKTLAKGPKNENAQLVDIIRVLLALLSQDRLPPDAVAIRDQEYDADDGALIITDNINSAISCLTKISGGDLTSTSHFWDLMDKKLAIMSLNERIDTMKKRYYYRKSLDDKYV